MTILERLEDANQAISKIINVTRNDFQVKVFTLVVKELLTPFLKCENENIKKMAKETLSAIGPTRIFKFYLNVEQFVEVLKYAQNVIKQELPREREMERISRIIKMGMDRETEKQIKKNAKKISRIIM